MARLGVLGGMGSMATAEFILKLVEMTPATRDQEHIPYVLLNLPQIPDRTEAIVGNGVNPLPMLLQGIDQLLKLEVGIIAIPCNTCHHWYEEIASHSPVPVFDMPKIAIDRVPVGANTLLLATAGTVRSGFFQANLEAKRMVYSLPQSNAEQAMVDQCIHQVKAGHLAAAGGLLREVLRAATNRGVTHVC